MLNLGRVGRVLMAEAIARFVFFENYNIVRVLCRGVAISIFVVERGQKIVWAKKNE